MKRWFFFALPLVLLGLLLAFFLTVGSPGILSSARIPVERVAVQRIELKPGEIVARIMNDGPDTVTIAQVLVNDAYRQFRMEPVQTLKRLQRATLRIPYPWLEAEPLHIVLVSSSGVTFSKEVPAAAATPAAGGRYFGSLALLGVYIGVIPVFLGVLWLPFLRNLRSAWFQFLLALTLGLLFFLGVDSLVEAIEAVGDTPQSLLGTGLVTVGFSAAFLLVFAVTRRRSGKSPAEVDEGARRRGLAFAIAFGIGVHNMGEGLAIGGAYAVGNVALGSLLVIGFMIHNVTEGIAIVAPISRIRSALATPVLLALLAGAPAILGAWLGGLAYSALWAVLFLSLGAGAIFQVFIEILGQMSREGVGALLTFRNVLGFLAGLLVMYGTAILIPA